ncbi:MAG: PRC-barrel domain containing protein [Mesorhizobium sp.]|uniref:PRC-barrel domain-containing protein n=1 Tax=unclassified Mesorhizobium TaxID=325217 RepID=UPI000FCCD442|nr:MULTISPECIES: PRC-barrel domain-containing protein [unclassified Mesorhizobium]RUV71434.1 PRC-barrel domain containing protein [Mesorhizobium sp. M5C.F.Cr.IN.023.01.1.1]RWF82142.1 MAG: PRC-barrel domain containing protein [Mesorhizobium sp.]RWF93516.1 MAG: PRC-barrel domain containing protein [Mesorhizobium sp.]RWI41454.1 MAG: PRC-barrel domain containing protein [Mesorhizobium sp.]RWI49556.1 MAG: PRC-barrel domain containing protein [Mesorhizobium sp.]
MIRTLLTTTALAALLATGAYAQTATTPAPTQDPAVQDTAPAAPVARAEGSLVTNIIGETVYNGTGDDAENIGNVDDVVFDENGQAKSVIIGVGGFLGIGAKNVAFDYNKLEWAERNGDRWLIAQTTKDELTAQPDFDRRPYDPVPAATDTTATAPPAPSGTTDTTAQNAPAAPVEPVPAEPVKRADGNLATNIIGETVYNGTGDDAQNIGDVNDIVLAKDGKAESLIIGVGGFLEVGEKNVAYEFDKAKWAERDGDRWLVAETTKEDLEALPEFNREPYDPAPATTASTDAAAPAPVTTTPAVTPAPAEKTAEAPAATPDPAAPAPADKTAQAPATTTDPAAPAPADTTAEAPAAATPDATPDQTQTAAIDKSALTEMPINEIRSEDLVGTTVYGANDVNVGEIGDVVLTGDKKVDAVIIDVGGFLGVGEKEVAVGMDNLKFMTDKDGNRYLYTNFTKEQLEAQVAYDKGTYTQKRDEQRMMMR